MRFRICLLAEVVESLGEVPVLRAGQPICPPRDEATYLRYSQPIFIHPAQIPKRHGARLCVRCTLVRSDRFFIRILVALDADTIICERGSHQSLRMTLVYTYSNSRRPLPTRRRLIDPLI